MDFPGKSAGVGAIAFRGQLLQYGRLAGGCVKQQA